MFDLSAADLITLLHHFSYIAIFLVIAGESMGIPLPGETMLLTASIYAGSTHRLSIYLVIFAAIMGAILGDNWGYGLGRSGGYTLLRKYGKYIKVDESKLKVGQYLFIQHGGKIVFFGRFFSLLRVWAAFLAGVNKMAWKRFLVYNAGGGIIWATFYGTLGYILGKHVNELSKPLRLILLIAGSIIVILSFFYVRYNIQILEKKAKKAIPGPLGEV
jgi:membrane protein DedA with SNARE-associated domain